MAYQSLMTSGSLLWGSWGLSVAISIVTYWSQVGNVMLVPGFPFISAMAISIVRPMGNFSSINILSALSLQVLLMSTSAWATRLSYTWRTVGIPGCGSLKELFRKKEGPDHQ